MYSLTPQGYLEASEAKRPTSLYYNIGIPRIRAFDGILRFDWPKVFGKMIREPDLRCKILGMIRWSRIVPSKKKIENSKKS